MGGPTGPHVDQVVFRWTGNRSARGAGISAVAYSCGAAEARDLADALAPVLRVGRGDGRTSYARVRNGGRAVVLRRTSEPDAQGRDCTMCHALVGPAELLRTQYCLGLGDRWPLGERDGAAPGPLPVVELGGLDAEVGAARHRLLRAVPLVARPLESLVAQLLRAPTGRVSAKAGELAAAVAAAPPDVRAAAGEDPPDAALLVLWGLSDIFDDWLRGPYGWTYATYDSVDDYPYRVVFVSDWRGSAEVDPHRKRIDLTDPGPDAAAFLARGLVSRYLRRPPGERPRKLLGAVPDAATAPEDERYRMIAELLGGRGRPVGRAAPRDMAGRQSVTRQTAPQQTVPQQSAPRQSASQQSVPGQDPLWTSATVRPAAAQAAPAEPAAPPASTWTPPAGGTGRPDDTVTGWAAATQPVQTQPTPTPTPSAPSPAPDQQPPPPPHPSAQSPVSPTPVSPPPGRPWDAPYRPPLGYGPPPGAASAPPAVIPPKPDHPPTWSTTQQPQSQPQSWPEPSPESQFPVVPRPERREKPQLPPELPPGFASGLQAAALPAFLRTRARWRHGSNRGVKDMDTALYHVLVDNLRLVATQPGMHADLRVKIVGDLGHASDADQVRLLTEDLPFAAHNIVLEKMADIQRSEKDRKALCELLLARQLCPEPVPRDPESRALYGKRRTRVVCWFFRWLMWGQAADAHKDRLAEVFEAIAASRDPSDREIVRDLFLTPEPKDLPWLPPVVWRAVISGTDAREARPPSETTGV
jgi:hypothetical protein